MKIPEPYKCDYCPATKRETNHWYLGLVIKCYDAHALRTHTVVMPWIAELADRPGTKHLCGVECMQKFVSKNPPVILPAEEGAKDDARTEAAQSA